MYFSLVLFALLLITKNFEGGSVRGLEGCWSGCVQMRGSDAVGTT